MEQRLQWFKKNPEDTRLDNHGLRRKMKGQWAINLNGGMRIVYKWTGENEACLLKVGSHWDVYYNEDK